jgi:hypothetical protein
MLFSRGGPKDASGRRHFRLRPMRRLCGLLLLAVALSSGLLALTLVQFVRLTTDLPVAQVSMLKQAPQSFLVTVQIPDQNPHHYTLAGDQWQVDAKVIRWKLPALLAGAPALYTFERLSGRYDNIEQEKTDVRSVYDLSDWPVPDLAALKRVFPDWLPFVDVQYGSAAYMPMMNEGEYLVYVDPRGGLVVRPNSPLTRDGLRQRGW